MNSSSIKKFSGNFASNFFKKLEFMELKLYSKLEFQNSGRLIYILINSGIWPFSSKNNVKQRGNIIST